MRNVLLGFEFILAAVIIVVVLLQPSKADGIKGFITGNSETFFSKNKSRTKEAMLARVTVVSAILFAITTIALNIVK
ncbi:preprotein translocase subunit SecG [Desnuesiella massiliensis]|uniref:preprotein translocase subunit SecG n=1 Tax=Desnuesiella massiliensis TaxID=1650662 RepID=UPI0006E45032|nr:preprotein translocase subunit SecG [Desnuesiella massiliensis]